MTSNTQSRSTSRLTRRVSRLRAVACGLVLLLTAALPAAALLSGDQAEELYRKGQQALAEGQYTAAVDQFRALSEQSNAQVDRALYWKAYAESKANRSKDALATLKRLGKDFPKSAWLDDARALEVELGGSGRERVLQEGDEDLKLYALDALHQADPERATTLLEEFLAANHSPRLKQHALFVLAQTGSPRAEQVLLRIARDPKNGALQREAISALGVTGEESATAALVEIYRTSTDRATKEQVLHALIPADAPKAVADIAISEKDPELQRQAVHALGAMDGVAELDRVAKALGPGLREAIYQAYGIAGQSAPLLRVLRESKDAGDLKAAIDALAILGDEAEIAPELLRLYRSTADREIKERVLSALMVADDAKSLLEIFRAEQEPRLKRQALQYLSMLDDPEVQKLIEQLIKS